jgi:hypothetical protein
MGSDPMAGAGVGAIPPTADAPRGGPDRGADPEILRLKRQVSRAAHAVGSIGCSHGLAMARECVRCADRHVAGQRNNLLATNIYGPTDPLIRQLDEQVTHIVSSAFVRLHPPSPCHVVVDRLKGGDLGRHDGLHVMCGSCLIIYIVIIDHVNPNTHACMLCSMQHQHQGSTGGFLFF